MRIILLASFFLFFNYGFAERCILPMRHGNHEEIYIQGGKALLSNGLNSSIMMFNTCPKLKGQRGNFYFSIANHTRLPLHFLVHQLTVTDQWGRRVRVVPKQELIHVKKRQKSWKLFFSGLLTGLQSIDAESAGDIEYRSCTDTRIDTSIRNRDSHRNGNSAIHERARSKTHATIHSEALRQQAQREIDRDAAVRRGRIRADYNYWKHGLTNYYFDSRTLFPEDIYGANLQIEVPKGVEQDLEYLIFTFDLAGEKHSFSFYCGNHRANRFRRKI